MNSVLYKDESYKIIGCCLEVYNALGKGFLEVVYKDAYYKTISSDNIAQTLNYLKVTGYQLSILANLEKVHLTPKECCCNSCN